MAHIRTALEDQYFYLQQKYVSLLCISGRRIAFRCVVFSILAYRKLW